MATMLDRAALRQRLEATKAALVVGHIKPDGDCIGSVLALTEALRRRGVIADALIADDVATKFHYLAGAAEIVSTIPDKAYDTVLFMDLSTAERAGELPWPAVPIVNIDHHISNPGYADELYLDATAAAVGEILTELFLEWGWEISPTMAQALYTAIATDCGFFKYANTTEKTMRMAAALLARGADQAEVAQRTEELPPAALRVLPQIMATLTLEADGALSAITMDAGAMAAGGDYVDTYLELARNIEGVEVTLQFKYAEPEKTYVSFRSKTAVDVSALAAEFGGGGHIRAAGCTVWKSLADTISTVMPVAVAWTRDGRRH